jgi:PleD family two-component response regulator
LGWALVLDPSRVIEFVTRCPKFTFGIAELIGPASLTLPEDCNAAAGESELDDVVTILVVEDDHLIQAMVEEALSDGGFESTTTASGEEAIALIQNDNSQYRAIMTDINLLGKLDGWEVARAAREINPTIPCHLYDRYSWRSMGI